MILHICSQGSLRNSLLANVISHNQPLKLDLVRAPRLGTPKPAKPAQNEMELSTSNQIRKAHTAKRPNTTCPRAATG